MKKIIPLILLLLLVAVFAVLSYFTPSWIIDTITLTLVVLLLALIGNMIQKDV